MEFMDLKLLDAARSGKLQIFQELAKDVQIYDQTTPEGNTVLHMAARFGHMDLVEEIVKQHSTLVLKSNLKGETPVHIAARAGQLQVVKFFIKLVENFPRIYIARIRDKYGNTPLHDAVRNRHDEVVKELASDDKESLLLTNDAGESPLSTAIDKRFTDIANSIISLNAYTLESIGHNGQTPLHYTVLRNDSDTMTAILRLKKHLVRVQDEKERTPLHYAAALGNQAMVQKLLEKDPLVAYIRDYNHQTPVHLAAENGQKSMIKTLLERCPDTMEMVDKKQQNILHLAAKAGNLDVVSYILKLDEMEDLVNSHDADGNTPLHLATKNCYSDVVDALSKSPKVEIRAINNENKTALAIAKLPDKSGMELQKHLTLKALKFAYEGRGIDPDDTLENTQLDDVEKSHEVGEKGQQMAKRISFMSPLIATFTFTGAFTIPGGFKNNGPDEGLATLISKAAFWVFVISDTIAMVSSISSAVITFWSVSRGDRESFMDTLPFSIFLTWISLIAMTVAFVTGLFVVLQKKLMLAILVCAIGGFASFLLYVIAPLLLIEESRPNQRNIVEENPLLFVVQSIELRAGIRIRSRIRPILTLIRLVLSPLKYLWLICKWLCCCGSCCCERSCCFNCFSRMC
ncbi:hypothetical protein PTKIN_Ptkin14bG0060300 [Pterospermum kingtungense]